MNQQIAHSRSVGSPADSLDSASISFDDADFDSDYTDDEDIDDEEMDEMMISQFMERLRKTLASK